MKKLITSVFTLLLVMTLSNQSNAQLAAKAGLVFANQTVSFGGLSVSADSQLGAQLGVTYTKMINDNFNFRPGLLYTMKGASSEGEGTTLGYVGVPLDAVYGVPVGDHTLNLHFGPYLDFLLHGTEGATEALKSLDLGVNLGAEIDLGQFGIGLNISRGLSNISETESDDGLGGIIDLGDITAKNQYFALYVTYDL